MYSLVSGIYDRYLTPPQVNLLLIGVSGSGKTTLLERIKVTDLIGPHPLPDRPVSPEPLRSTRIFTHPGTSGIFAAAPAPRRRRPPTARYASRWWICPLPPLLPPSLAPRSVNAPQRSLSDRLDNRSDRQQQSAGTSSNSSGGMMMKDRMMMMMEDDTSMVSASNNGGIVVLNPSHRVVDTLMIDNNNNNMNDDAGTIRSADTTDTNSETQELLPRKGGRKAVVLRKGTGTVAGLPPPRRVSDGAAQMAVMDRSGGGGGGGTTLLSRSYSHDEDMDTTTTSPVPPTNIGTTTTATTDDNNNDEQFDLLPGKTMLDRSRIRPTIGMNLAKLPQVCGARLHVWDLGGRLQTLWERYYADADGVLFCWKLAEDDDDTANDSVEAQRQALHTVRAAVDPDVPFVVLGHLFQPHPPHHCEPDILHSATPLWASAAQQQPPPYYTNTGLFFVNATTGQGVKTAVEWLVSAAVQRQRAVG